MSYKKMPPQAYTKETLQEAFEWWNQQPDEFRDKVQDKDDLVGYYLRVRRKASGSSDISDVAKASFSSELKGLAKNLDNFEGYNKSQKAEAEAQAQAQSQATTVPSYSETRRPQEAPSTKTYTNNTTASYSNTQQNSNPGFEPSMQLKFPDLSKSPVVTEEEPSSPTPENAAATTASKPTASKNTLSLSESSQGARSDLSDRYFKLDEKSLQTIRKTRQALNLSTEAEALRAIIALGESKIKSIL